MNRPPSPEVLFQLVADDIDRMREIAADLILRPDAERTMILGFHMLTEQILTEVLEALLPEPKVWIDGANYWSKVNLVRAMGYLDDVALNACRVIGKARNNVVHRIEPLPPTLRTELYQLAFGSDKSEDDTNNTPLYPIIRALLAHIVLPWIYVKTERKRIKLYQAHREVLSEVVARTMKQHPEMYNEALSKRNSPEALQELFRQEPWQAMFAEIETEMIERERTNPEPDRDA